MGIKITNDTTKDATIEFELLVSTLEKNRDRVRATASMVMSLSGVSISASLGIIYLVFREDIVSTWSFTFLSVAPLLLLASSAFAIECSFFRSRKKITNEFNFLNDLQKLFEREIGVLRLATSTCFLGLISLAFGVILQVFVGG